MIEKTLQLYADLIDHIFNDVYKLTGDVSDTWSIVHDAMYKAKVELDKTLAEDDSAINSLVKHKHGAVEKREHTVGLGLNNPPLFIGTVYASSAADNMREQTFEAIAAAAEDGTVTTPYESKPVYPNVKSPHNADVELYKSGLEQYKQRVDESINDVSIRGVVRRSDSVIQLFRGDKPVFKGLLHVDGKRHDIPPGIYDTIMQFKEKVTNG